MYACVNGSGVRSRLLFLFVRSGSLRVSPTTGHLKVTIAHQRQIGLRSARPRRAANEVAF